MVNRKKYLLLLRSGLFCAPRGNVAVIGRWLLLFMALLLASRLAAGAVSVNAQDFTPTPFVPTPVSFEPTPVVPLPISAPAYPSMPAATITVLGYGTAAAPADSVIVRLSTSSTTLPVANVDIIQQLVTALSNSGIVTSDIVTNAFAQGTLLPGQPASEVRFTFNTPQNLDGLLTNVQAALPGVAPGSLALSTVFQVNDCAGLETQAVQAALINAQAKAGQMAALLGVQLGSLISASEAINDDLVNTTNSVNCLKLAVAAHSPATSGLGLGNNSVAAVELWVILQATYAVEGGVTNRLIAPPVFDSEPSPNALIDGGLPVLSVISGTQVVNVRSAPNTDSEVLGVVRTGEQYLITGRNDLHDWWQIDFSGQPGWVIAQLVMATNTANVPVIDDEPAP